MKRYTVIGLMAIALTAIIAPQAGAEILGDPNVQVDGELRIDAAGVNDLRIRDTNGFVGLGLGVPTAELHIRSAGVAGLGPDFKLENNAGGRPRFILTGGGASWIMNATATGDFSFFKIGTGNVLVLGATGNIGIGTSVPGALLDVAGTGRVEILEITGGSDLSELFNVQSAGTEVKPGMVVSIDPSVPGSLMVSTKPYDRAVAGIISGAGGLNTGMTMGQQGSEVANGAHPVALTGRVYCYVDGSYGAVQAGDMLTTSATPGHAMKVTEYGSAHGAVIGKAMTSLAQGEKGLVLVLVSLQ